MKKHQKLVRICILGIVVASGIVWVAQSPETTQKKPVAVRYVMKASEPTPKKFEWRQPLLHPTYPPKLVQGEEFVLK